LLAAIYEVQLAQTVAKAVIVVFAATDMVAAAATLLNKTTMQAAAPERLHEVAEKSQEVAAMVRTTTAA
jgi:hypothetical protein